MVRPDPDTSLVGKLLGDYEMLEVIGDGGVGVVYRARHVKLERLVAVKVLHESLVEEAGFVGRFQREAVAMSRLYHPHCIAVIDSGVYESRPYLVLEYLPGQTITQLLEQGRFEPQRAVHIALQLLETLEYFHGHHVIHRDLKSENVMLVESAGTMDFVKVLDFGMAKILMGPGSDSQLSLIGIVPGTPSAMAPEQIYQLPPDPRIDIYAMGILLYEMIVGRRPFSGPDMATVVKMQISTPPKPPREILGEVALSEALEQVVIKALEKDRVDRYGTAREMATALRLTREALPSSAPAQADPQPTLKPAPVRETRRLVMGVGAAFALGAAVAALSWPKSTAPRATISAALGSTHTATAPAAAPAAPPTPPAPVPAPPPVAAPAAAPLPAAAAEPEAPAWLAHRDRALDLAERGEPEAAMREVRTALAEDPKAAGADANLAKGAANALDAKHLAFVVDAFRANPQLADALAEVTSQGKTSELRHAARDGLRMLGQEARADLVAMRILDVEQANTCAIMRDDFKQLRTAKDPRVSRFKAALRARGRKDRHVRCLKRALR